MNEEEEDEPLSILLGGDMIDDGVGLTKVEEDGKFGVDVLTKGDDILEGTAVLKYRSKPADSEQDSVFLDLLNRHNSIFNNIFFSYQCQV